MSETEYTTVSVILKARGRNAIGVVSIYEPDEDLKWIAHSCIFGPDEKSLKDHNIGDRMTIRVFSWLAKKENID